MQSAAAGCRKLETRTPNKQQVSTGQRWPAPGARSPCHGREAPAALPNCPSGNEGAASLCECTYVGYNFGHKRRAQTAAAPLSQSGGLRPDHRGSVRHRGVLLGLHRPRLRVPGELGLERRAGVLDRREQHADRMSAADRVACARQQSLARHRARLAHPPLGHRRSGAPVLAMYSVKAAASCSAMQYMPCLSSASIELEIGPADLS